MMQPSIFDNQIVIDQGFMGEALREARQAAVAGDVPIGAIIVYEGLIIARGFNQRELDGDPTAHAEVMAIRAAAAIRKHWRLTGTTLYTTLEPCPMCAGAMVQARIGRLVYGATDPKAGAAGSLMNLVQDPRLNHRLEVTAGVLADECGQLLKDFFRERR